MVITKDKPAIDTQKIKIEWTRLVKEVVESQRKTAKEAKKKKNLQSSQKQQIGNSKSLSINTYFKYKWIKLSNQRTEELNG